MRGLVSSATLTALLCASASASANTGIDSECHAVADGIEQIADFRDMGWSRTNAVMYVQEMQNIPKKYHSYLSERSVAIYRTDAHLSPEEHYDLAYSNCLDARPENGQSNLELFRCEIAADSAREIGTMRDQGYPRATAVLALTEFFDYPARYHSIISELSFVIYSNEGAELSPKKLYNTALRICESSKSEISKHDNQD